jgi:hypothetical protein
MPQSDEGDEQTMSKFTNAKEAKEFLVSKIASEAQLEGVRLTETERKELYLSETAWTLPEMAQINEEFEQHFDPAEYEEKIVSLIRNARKRDRQANAEDVKLWSEAIGVLSGEDHYILVMVRRAGISIRPPGDFAKLLGAAFAVIVVLMCLILVAQRLNIDVSKEAVRFYTWAIAAAAVVFYTLSSVVLGQKRTNDLVGTIAEKIATRFVRTK